MKRKALNRRAQNGRDGAKRAALNALKRAKRAADRAGIDLSVWEGEFLGSVAERVNRFGRAFGDPEKGAPGHALSALQTIKLREIVAKASGKTKGVRRFSKKFTAPL